MEATEDEDIEKLFNSQEIVIVNIRKVSPLLLHEGEKEEKKKETLMFLSSEKENDFISITKKEEEAIGNLFVYLFVCFNSFFLSFFLFRRKFSDAFFFLYQRTFVERAD